jgi:Rrf2 family protein
VTTPWRLSRTSTYAVAAAVRLAQGNAGVTAVCELASGLPEKFLRRLLGRLVRAGVLRSERGPIGGYWLARPAGAITLLEIVEAVDGPVRFDDAGDVPPTVAKACERATEDGRRALAGVTVADLAGRGKKRSEHPGRAVARAAPPGNLRRPSHGPGRRRRRAGVA